MPLCRGKSGKEALCCLRPPADLYPTACPAAWEVAFHTVLARPPPACRAHIRTLQGEARLTTHRHRISLCGKQSSEYAASPAAWGVPSHTVPARPRPAGHTCARSKGKPGSLPTDTGSPFAVSDPLSTPPASAAWGVPFSPAPFRSLLRIRQSRPTPPLLPPNPPHSKKTGHTRRCVLFFYGIRKGYALAERI